MIRVLVSSCLLGERVRHDGRDARTDDDILLEWQRQGRVVPFCPEVAGGFPVPRTPAEIKGGDGHDVLRRAAQVVDREGLDVTEGFLSGAQAAVEVASRHGAKLAILEEGSPSCGSGRIHDGTFEGSTRPGPGVTAAALSHADVRVFGEDQLPEALRHLQELESEGRAAALERDGSIAG